MAVNKLMHFGYKSRFRKLTTRTEESLGMARIR